MDFKKFILEICFINFFLVFFIGEYLEKFGLFRVYIVERFVGI